MYNATPLSLLCALASGIKVTTSEGMTANRAKETSRNGLKSIVTGINGKLSIIDINVVYNWNSI